MKLNDFMLMVKKDMEKRTGKAVKIREVMKNNGSIRHALMVENRNQKIAPVIYMEPYYDSYIEGCSLRWILEEIFDVYENSVAFQGFDVESFIEYEKVRSKIYYKIVNKELNRKMLEDVPWEQFLDLAKVYYVSVDTEEGYGHIVINRYHLDMWGICEDIMKADAEKNMADAEVEVTPMEEILLGMNVEVIEDGEIVGLSGIYVMKLKELQYGAAAVCIDRVLSRLADQMAMDIIILPSSVCEVLLLPVGEGFGEMSSRIKEFKHMVREVNQTNLELEERLSYNVYLYRRETGRVEIV